MKKILLGLVILTISTFSIAAELITIFSPYSPSHSGNAAMREVVNTANLSQNKYKFIIELKPGGDQIISVNSLNANSTNSLSVISSKYVEHVLSGKLKESNYIPIHALGDACWAVISNIGNSKEGIKSLSNYKEIIVGGVGLGSATHLTSLEIAEKYDISVQYIFFKSNNDALITMAGQDAINLSVDRIVSFNNLKDKNKNLKVLALSCPTRHPSMPEVLTLAEQGIDAPYIFNMTIAHVGMPTNKRIEIGKILNNATITVGKEKILFLSDMNPPIFSNISISDYYNMRVKILKTLISKHQFQVINK